MIKIKTVLANFGSEKQFKVKEAYFITAEIDLIGEKQPFLTNKLFLNDVKVKFLQIKDIIRQKHARDVRTEMYIHRDEMYLHRKRDTPLPLYTSEHFG